MWRAFFLAIGLFLAILGCECLAVDKAILRVRDEPPPAAAWLSADPQGPNKTVTPPPWAPWTFLGAGAVTCIYSFTLPKRVGGG